MKNFHSNFFVVLGICFNLTKVISDYKVGVGIADITGPAAEVGMMGYGKASQVGAGIHTRLFSRAFIFDDGQQRVVFVSVDSCMIDHIIKIEVMSKLSIEFGNVYKHQNVLLSATHTHSGPGGFLQYVLFSITTFGFVKQTFEAMTTGIVESIRRAHFYMKPAKVYFSEGELHNANINRSPMSYLANPEPERARYQYDTDRQVYQLNIFDAISGVPMGIINWFSVHANSMNNTNLLISGDNKGYASQIFEKHINGNEQRPGKGSFVAAFVTTNSGDVSPNLKGPKCIDTGLDCDEHSTCNGKNQNCIALGPGENMFESTKIIGELQYQKAVELFKDNSTEVTGQIRFAHQWIDMADREVTLTDGQSVKTCLAALGYGFGAGTTDGPGESNFEQGSNNSNPFWDSIVGIIQKPSEEQKQCHAPKAILLSTGEINFPYPWEPRIVDTQIIQIGQVLIAGIPGEPTTMAGRRLKDDIIEASKNDSLKVMITGLSNVYTHYITTFEEYQNGRYEAASTIFGPHTLMAYQQQYMSLTQMMLEGETISPGPEPPNLLSDQISFLPGVIYDNPPLSQNFGDVIGQPQSEVQAGDTVVASFISGHPRNDLMLEKTFLTVERQDKDGSWKVVANDADWETRFKWFRTDLLKGNSIVEITWNIPQDVKPGIYKIRHFGHSKIFSNPPTPYEGTTNSFVVKNTKPKTKNKKGHKKKHCRKKIVFGKK